jgi:cytochrome c
MNASSKELADNPEYLEGLTLVSRKDCFNCHDISKMNIGPSYKAVASQYSGADNNTINSLGSVIINGGSGTWGSVPMPAHPDLTEKEASTIVKYILLLNN